MKQYDLKLLSKYRTQLMGFATLWIAFYHTSLVFYIPVISEMKWSGYAGVELFLFISGIGLFFSWNNNPSLSTFYRKRLLRILPMHVFIALIFTTIAILLYSYDVSYLFYSITTLGFWLNKGDLLTSPWFISAIILFYAITPIFLKYVRSKILIYSILISLLAIITTILITNTNFKYLQIFTARIPIFFIGLYVGYLIIKEIKLSAKNIFIQIIFFTVGQIWIISIFHNIGSQVQIIKYGLIWYPFILTTFPLCILLTLALEVTPKYILSTLTFFGIYSLPIYLYHEKILFLLTYHTNISGLNLNILAIIIAIILAYLTQNTITYITDKSYKRLNSKPKNT